MRTEFPYRHNGQYRIGLLVYEDSLGPLSVLLHQGELCLTYCSGCCQAGGVNALYIRQEIDAIVKFRHINNEDGDDNLLAGFVDDWIPDTGTLREVIRELLAEYL
jgi:hypothetical protein